MSRRPPDSVAFLARTHWAMGGVILLFTLLLFALLRDSMVFELSRRMYAIMLALGLLYWATGVLLWFGIALARPLNYICSLLYLARPPLGMRIWKIMRSAEYKAHFQRLPAGP